MRTEREGFTLVELMVVISIIALLLALLMPSLSRAREGAKRQVCANQLKQNSVAIHAYAGDYNYGMPWWGYEADGDEEIHPYVVYRGGGQKDADYRFPTTVATDPWDPTKGKLKAMRMACLYEGKYITEPKVFYCPSNKDALYKFESYTDPPPWGRMPQLFNATQDNEWVRQGYEYYPTDPKTPTEKRVYDGVTYYVPKETTRKILGLNPHIPYMADVIRRRVHMGHQSRSTYAIHALFSDGHVVFCNDQDVFSGRIWYDWEKDTAVVDYKLFYYVIFRRISP